MRYAHRLARSCGAISLVATAQNNMIVLILPGKLYSPPAELRRMSSICSGVAPCECHANVQRRPAAFFRRRVAFDFCYYYFCYHYYYYYYYYCYCCRDGDDGIRNSSGLSALATTLWLLWTESEITARLVQLIAHHALLDMQRSAGPHPSLLSLASMACIDIVVAVFVVVVVVQQRSVL